MKLIMETWRRYINEDEISGEEAQGKWDDYHRGSLTKQKEGSWYGPGIAKLIEEPKLAMKPTWLAENIGTKIAAGYFREVYKIKGAPQYLLKVAKKRRRKAAAFTNEKEKRFFNKYPEFFPKVFLSSDTVVKQRTAGLPKWHGTESLADWLIVEKVKVPDQAEYNKLVLKAFPGIKKAIEYSKHLKISPEMMRSPEHYLEGVLKTMDSRPDKRQWRLEGFKHALKAAYENSPHTFLSKGKTTAEEYANRMWEMIDKDHMLTKLRALISELKIQPWDIRVENVGTRTGKEFLLIDIGIFRRSI